MGNYTNNFLNFVSK